MSFATRLFIPLCAAICAPLACSSSTDAPAPITPPPGGSSSSGAPSAGSGGTSAGSGGVSTAGASGGASECAAACPTGGFCKMGACACPADKADICPAGAAMACVSKQEDPDNCGVCGTKCAAGAACAAGVCGATPTDVVTATGCGSMRLAIQGTNIYWTENMTGAVKTAPVAGGAAVDVATAQLKPTQIVADATGVYWVNQGDGTAGSSKVMKKALPLAAGAPVVLKAAPATEKILAITVAAGKLYYTLGSDVHAISTDAAVTADAIVGSATNIDLMPPAKSGEPAGLAVQGTSVFWTTATRNGVESDDTAPGGALDNGGLAYKELGESQGSLLLSDIATDGTRAFWANGENVFGAAAKPPTLLTSTTDFSKVVAFDISATDVYFATDSGFIFKHPLTAPATPVAPKSIARSQLMTSALIVDTAKFYWASNCVIRSLPL